MHTYTLTYTHRSPLQLSTEQDSSTSASSTHGPASGQGHAESADADPEANAKAMSEWFRGLKLEPRVDIHDRGDAIVVQVGRGDCLGYAQTAKALRDFGLLRLFDDTIT
jgi:hypothetical protein